MGRGRPKWLRAKDATRQGHKRRGRKKSFGGFFKLFRFSGRVGRWAKKVGKR